MDEFKEKWKSDHRFQTKIKLALYTLFVVVVAIFATTNRSTTPENQLEKPYNNVDDSKNQNELPKIEIPEEYLYTINVVINDKEYHYTGEKSKESESITKEVDGTKTNYIYKNNSYYKEQNGTYILSKKEDVYDIVNYDYINLEMINEYLTKAVKKDNTYYVYLKDIILGSQSEEYITITTEQNTIDIDYTKLVNELGQSINTYLVKFEIQNKE